MAAPKKFDVFLSHNSKDKPWVIELKNSLQTHRVKVWLDKDEIRPGDLFAEALEKGLQESRSVALIISPEAMASGWVKAEYYRALSLATSGQLQLIPVLYRKAEIPGFLQDRNWVDFSVESEYIQNVAKLVWGITGEKPSATSIRKPLGKDKLSRAVHHETPQASVVASLPFSHSVLLRKSGLESLEKIFDKSLVFQVDLYKNTLREMEEFLDMGDLSKITLAALKNIKNDTLAIIDGFRKIQTMKSPQIYTLVRSVDQMLDILRMIKRTLFEVENLFEGDKLSDKKRRIFFEKMEACRAYLANALKVFVA